MTDEEKIGQVYALIKSKGLALGLRALLTNEVTDEEVGYMRALNDIAAILDPEAF